MLETLPVLPVALRIKASVEPLCNLAFASSSSSAHTPNLLAREALATWQSRVFLGFTKPASILEACLLLLLSGSLFLWLLACLAFSHPLGFCLRAMPLKKKALCRGSAQPWQSLTSFFFIEHIIIYIYIYIYYFFLLVCYLFPPWNMKRARTESVLLTSSSPASFRWPGDRK